MCKYCGDQHVILELKDLHILTDKKLEKAVDILNKATGERLYVDPGKAMAEISPYKAVRDLELRSKIRVELLLFDLYTQIDNKWLHVVKAIDNTPFKIGNKTFLNPRSGKSLTKTEWKQIKADLMKAFGYIYGKEEERIVKVAMALGKILNQMPVPDAIVTPFTAITLDVKVPAETDAYQNALNFAEEYTAQLITSVTERQYTKIHDVILTAQKNRFSTGQLSATLFDTFGDMNKDWRRIAETEIANNVNNGQLITELNRSKEEYVFMKGVSSPDACAWCASKVNNNIVILMDLPPEDGTDRMVVDGKTYTVIWPGKDNHNRSRKNWWVSAGTQHPCCYAKTTEVMTNHGWKLFKDVAVNDLIMAINPKNRHIDFVKYINKIEYMYEGKMIHFNGRSLDMVVTPDHNMLYIRNDDRVTLRETSAKELIKKKGFSIPRAIGLWEGRIDYEKFENSYGFSIKSLVRTWAWLLSEGDISIHNKSRGYYALRISQSDTTKVLDSLFELKDVISVGRDYVRIYRQDIIRIFDIMKGVKSYDKYIPSFIKELPVELLKEFLDVYIEGDGCIVDTKSYNKGISKAISIVTSSKRMADDLCEIVIKLGKVPTCSIRDQIGNPVMDTPYVSKRLIYKVYVGSRAFKKYEKSNAEMYWPEYVDYKGMVYDVELEKWHHLLVRRNGKVAWSGNCRCSWIKYTPGFEDWHDKLSEAIAQATKETQDAIIPEFIMDEEPLFIQEMRAKQVLKNQ